MDSSVRYEERSRWPWWVHLLILGTGLICLLPLLDLGGHGQGGAGPGGWTGDRILPLSLAVGIPLLFYAIFGDLRARITNGEIRISWGWTEIIRKRVSIVRIVTAEAVTYSPLKEFGGWGIRFGRNGKRAWNIRGNRAVRLELTDGSVFYLGSQAPERLVGWIRADPSWIQSRPVEEEQ